MMNPTIKGGTAAAALSGGPGPSAPWFPPLRAPPAASSSAQPVAALLGDGADRGDEGDDEDDGVGSGAPALNSIEILGFIEEVAKYYGEDAYVFSNQEQFISFVLDGLDSVLLFVFKTDYTSVPHIFHISYLILFYYFLYLFFTESSQDPRPGQMAET